MRQMTICNAKVAFNGKFFVIGLVNDDESRLGIFSFKKATWRAKPLKWVTKFLFSNFEMDDHLTTVMFLDKAKRVLDYNFLLWRYDTSKLDHESLDRLDAETKINGNEDQDEKPQKKSCADRCRVQ